eukprot:scaffold5125_cov134-Isochrysis_galbana.AAC.6
MAQPHIARIASDKHLHLELGAVHVRDVGLHVPIPQRVEAARLLDQALAPIGHTKVAGGEPREPPRVQEGQVIGTVVRRAHLHHHGAQGAEAGDDGAKRDATGRLSISASTISCSSVTFGSENRSPVSTSIATFRSVLMGGTR